MKADVILGNGSNYYLKLTSDQSWAGKIGIYAFVNIASWGDQGNGMQAKLYIKTGSGWTWYDGGSIVVTSNNSGTKLSLSLCSIPNLNDVKEIGIEFMAGANSSGQSSIYVDDVTAY